MITVPCIDCRTPVELAPSVFESVKAYSQTLSSRGEYPLAEDEIARCHACYVRWQEILRERGRGEYQQAIAVLRDLRDGLPVPQHRMSEAMRGSWGNLVRDHLASKKQLTSRGSELE